VHFGGQVRHVPSRHKSLKRGYSLPIDAQCRAMWRRSTWSTYFAQRITMCSASGLAEERSIFSPLQRPVACKKASPSDVYSFRGALISIDYKLRKIKRVSTGVAGFPGSFPRLTRAHTPAGGRGFGKNGPKRPRHPRYPATVVYRPARTFSTPYASSESSTSASSSSV
jgi:hypothetical protein